MNVLAETTHSFYNLNDESTKEHLCYVNTRDAYCEHFGRQITSRRNFNDESKKIFVTWALEIIFVDIWAESTNRVIKRIMSPQKKTNLTYANSREEYL